MKSLWAYLYIAGFLTGFSFIGATVALKKASTKYYFCQYIYTTALTSGSWQIIMPDGDGQPPMVILLSALLSMSCTGILLDLSHSVPSGSLGLTQPEDAHIVRQASAV